MALRCCVLGSGSRGNCTLVATDNTAVLIDAGFSGREVTRRLNMIGWSLDRIHAICLTHEHDDHRSALGTLQRRHGLPLYANQGAIDALKHNPKYRGLTWQVFTTGAAFRIGDLTLEPFSVPHDSYDPVGFAISAGAARVGIVSDMGVCTELIRQRLRGCQALVLEANHDEQLLREAARPWSLKQRIAGRQGHLSNRQAGELAVAVAHPALRHTLLAHLSADCNRPEIAEATVRQALHDAGFAHVTVGLTYPDRASVLLEVTADPDAAV